MTRDELLADLGARLRAADVEGFDATELATLVAADPRDVVGAGLLGLLALLRSDEAEALSWFARVLPWRPDTVPSVLLDRVAESAPPVGTTPAGWAGEAARLLSSTAAGNPAVLTRAVALLRRAGADYLALLSTAALARFNRLGELADLDEAIATARAAGHLANLGAALHTRFERTGDPADLDEAIAAEEQAEPDARLLSNLGIAYQSRFRRTGTLADLDQAIDLGQAAVAMADDADKPGVLANLSVAFHLRFDRVGDLADLDQAIATIEAALATMLDDDPRRATALANLAATRQKRFERLGDPADLDLAIATGRQAVAATPADHPDRAPYLANLAAALHTRGEPADIDEAITTTEQAIAATPPDHPDRVRRRANLGVLHHVRFEQTGAAADLDEAVAIGREAVAATPADHPERAVRQLNLGLALQSAGDRDAAIATLTAGLDLTTATPLFRVRCGAAAGRAGADQVWPKILDLLPRVLDRALGRDDRAHLLRDFADVGPSAAAARLAHGDAEGAWAVLEQGRGVLLSQALETTADPDLRRVHPGLADRVAQLRAELNDDQPAVRRSAAQQWDRLVVEIRHEPGFERWAEAPTIDELRRPVGAGQAVVAVNVTTLRCDALILTADGARSLPLPGLTRADAVERANQFQAAIRDRSLHGNRAMREVLAWLAQTVTAPILDQLGPTTTRVWWSPTGPLTLLPLHAADLDRVVPSYTPTVKILARAHGRAPRRDRGLAVGVGLEFAADEARQRRTATVLVDEQATRAAVLAGLATSTWAHLACHGVPRPDPADSHLVLADGTLPVREIAALDLSEASLAYLSACTTAWGGVTLPDEAIHIASAFQIAGFAHVVATLWPISDRHAPRLAERFYQHLDDGRDPATAVHQAVRELRDEAPDLPLLWAPYVHFGP